MNKFFYKCPNKYIRKQKKNHIEPQQQKIILKKSKCLVIIIIKNYVLCDVLNKFKYVLIQLFLHI